MLRRYIIAVVIAAIVVIADIEAIAPSNTIPYHTISG